MSSLHRYSVAFAIALLLACAALPSLAATGNPLKVALLLETPTGDHDWNDSLASGLDRARRELGVQTSVIVANKGSDDNALQEMFREAARNNDLVLVASNRLHEVLRNNAANFRRTMFGCIDAGVRAPNIMSVTFADEQAAYLAGAAAAMLVRQAGMPGISGSKKIGWLSGEDTPAIRSLLNGFTEGARVIDPEVRVVNTVTGSFGNAEAGRTAARGLLDQGADLLVLACGLGNTPALEEVKARKAYAIGLNTDQDNQYPGHVLTSILKHPDTAVFDIIASAASGHFQAKQIVVRDLANGGVGITAMKPFAAAAGKNFPPDMERRLGELRTEIMNGGIRLKSLRERTLCDCL